MMAVPLYLKTPKVKAPSQGIPLETSHTEGEDGHRGEQYDLSPYLFLNHYLYERKVFYSFHLVVLANALATQPLCRISGETWYFCSLLFFSLGKLPLPEDYSCPWGSKSQILMLIMFLETCICLFRNLMPQSSLIFSFSLILFPGSWSNCMWEGLAVIL